MTTYQGKNGRKLTGARLRANSSKKKKELGRAELKQVLVKQESKS